MVTFLKDVFAHFFVGTYLFYELDHYFSLYVKSLAKKLTEKNAFRKIHVCDHL